MTRRAASKLWALASLLAVLHVGSPLRASDAEVVEFRASDADCPRPGFVNERFWQLVGSKVQSPGRAVVTVTRTEDGQYEFLIAIEIEGEPRERRFSASSCQLGAETAALIIAISLFPERADDLERRAQDLRAGAESNAAPARRKPESKRRVQKPAPVPPPKPPPPVRRRSRPGPRIALSLQAGVDTMTEPAAAVGLGASGAWVTGRLLVEATAAQFLPQSLELPAGRGARFVLTTIGVHACYEVARGAVNVSPCLGATLLRLSGEGSGAQRNFERVGYLGGPAFGAAMRWRATERLALRIYAESYVSVVRPVYGLEARPVHQPPAVGLSAFVGPELRF